MKRNLLYGGIFLIVVLIAGVAYMLRPSTEASAPIEAVPLAIPTETAVPEASPAATEETEAPTDEAEVSTEQGGTVVYVISQQESEVRFSIDELLRNVPTTAVGVTDQIAGELAINFDAPAESQVGLITVNARTLATDNNNRNRMIRNEILDTDEFEFIVFSPTGLSGMPDRITPGAPVSFQISGDLTVRDVTAPVTFNVTAQVDDSGRLTGSAGAVVLRSTYGLTIPSVPSVAGVSDEVILSIDFVAYPK